MVKGKNMEKNKENQGNVQSNVKIEWDLTKIYSNIDELKKDIEKELSNRKNDNF